MLMNVLRVRPVTASVLQQEVTSRADEEIRPDEQHVQMEQESFQSKHVSRLEANAILPQSASLSYDQVYKVCGKKRRNSAWLDTQKRPVLVRPRLAVKQVRRVIRPRHQNRRLS